MRASEKIILALDFSDLKDVKKTLKQLDGQAVYYKVGLELFISHGWKVVELVKKTGARVFLDLKLHDIPNTVAKSVATACRHEIDILNVHALGGFEMMQRAGEAFQKNAMNKKAELIAVTILTSHDQKVLDKELRIGYPIPSQVVHLAKLAEKAGLSGVVASPLEVKLIRKAVEKKFRVVTPGVRPASADLNDQKRVYTPAQAIREGADYLVIGRPITQAKDPAKAFELIALEIDQGLKTKD
ncbi:MAG TPA: orotidine-5'-phosphate decarboxylase [Candidatus Omnitrophica bacterium]|nr:orotidine-5'-phosphate decarboxylase [Candidatus Omnitrophota bacterium]